MGICTFRNGRIILRSEFSVRILTFIVPAFCVHIVPHADGYAVVVAIQSADDERVVVVYAAEQCACGVFFRPDGTELYCAVGKEHRTIVQSIAVDFKPSVGSARLRRAEFVAGAACAIDFYGAGECGIVAIKLHAFVAAAGMVQQHRPGTRQRAFNLQLDLAVCRQAVFHVVGAVFDFDCNGGWYRHLRSRRVLEARADEFQRPRAAHSPGGEGGVSASVQRESGIVLENYRIVGQRIG